MNCSITQHFVNGVGMYHLIASNGEELDTANIFEVLAFLKNNECRVTNFNTHS